MCTIGFVREHDTVWTFKQCDLTRLVNFFTPQKVDSPLGPYLAFRREGRPGLWAGVNAHGVSFVAADYYTPEDPGYPPSPPAATSPSPAPTNPTVDRLFGAYEAAVARSKTAHDALAYLQAWYLHEGSTEQGSAHFPYPDIVMLADPQGAILLEYYPGVGVRTLRPGADYFVTTNHARLFAQTVDYAHNHSTYLRLERAEMLLDKAPNYEGICAMLRDQYYGATQLSICREAEESGAYFTQASVIFGATAQGITAHYIINANPKTQRYISMAL
jgi:hypothetical protein